MKRSGVFATGCAALALALCLTPALAASATSSVTVDDFLLAYARALRLDLPADAGSDVALAALRASGVKLDGTIAPGQALTQGDVVRIGKANGLRLSSSRPDAAFSAEELAQFFASYGATLSPAAGADRLAASDNPPGDPASRANTDKGKKKGRPFQSPTEPE